jgi:hypothetical protein
MNTRAVLSALICVLGIAGFVLGSDTATQPANQQEPCCFENPRYSGTCQVTPGPDEGCADILAYLNNPNSVGKSYCGNTKVRGGWTEVDCNGTASAVDQSCNEHRE